MTWQQGKAASEVVVAKCHPMPQVSTRNDGNLPSHRQAKLPSTQKQGGSSGLVSWAAGACRARWPCPHCLPGMLGTSRALDDELPASRPVRHLPPRMEPIRR